MNTHKTASELSKQASSSGPRVADIEATESPARKQQHPRALVDLFTRNGLTFWVKDATLIRSDRHI